MIGRPQSTLVLLVTCSRDEMRRDIAIKVMNNLAQVLPDAGLGDSFVVFDNASTFDDHLSLAPPRTVICRSPTNVGYWSAIRWVLVNRAGLLSRPFEYLYIVESDLWHKDLRPLADCEQFLRLEATASCVRTQEFSVRARWRFDKRFHWLPFHVTRSEVLLTNAVTGEPGWFRPMTYCPGLYLSNLHPKLPALNRIGALERVFGDLSDLSAFTEGDFFRLMMKQYPHIGILDGGLYYSLTSRGDRHRVPTGSYSTADTLHNFGYHSTRTAQFMPTSDIVVTRMTRELS